MDAPDGEFQPGHRKNGDAKENEERRGTGCNFKLILCCVETCTRQMNVTLVAFHP